MSSPSPQSQNMSSPPVPPSPPPIQTTTPGGVRRYHTISAHSRPNRSGTRPISEEHLDQPTSTEDDYVVPGEDWMNTGVGAIGEKSGSLHRQASLPTKYHSHKGYQAQARQSGPSTPLRTMNSLSAIQAEHGIDGEGEEEWETEMRDLRNSESETLVSSRPMSSAGASPLSPSFVSADAPSPPPVPSGAGVRRNQSLTYGPTHNTGATNLQRRGTLAGLKPRRTNTVGLGSDAPSAENPSPDTEEHFVEEEPEHEEEPLPQMPSLQQPQPQLYSTSTSGGRSPWGTPGTPEWRGANMLANNAYMPANTTASVMDDVQRALSTLELGPAGTSPGIAPQMTQMTTTQQSLSQPPRFANQTNHGARGSNMHSNGLRSSESSANQLLQNTGLQGSYGTTYVSPIGHGTHTQSPNNRIAGGMGMMGGRQGVEMGMDEQGGGGSWEQQERTLSPRSSNPNLQHQSHQNWNSPPPVPNIPQQYLQQQSPQSLAPRLAAMNYNAGLVQQQGGNNGGGQLPNAQNNPGYLGSPIDVPTLIKTKGYNPTSFDIRPGFARYFVIKSYTEDDVHKSLKYEIWSSTDPGNKRLDKAYKEVNGRGPIYLFFSVNASGHFCGMAEMLTPVDYTRSSTVWASDKWKGVFKVRWIFVRDIPNASLRHIRLNNTQERKPVTNSRDTQELLPEAGHEMLRIFFTHPARTSLLQDFAYYELQSLQKSPGTQAAPVPDNSSSQNASLYSASQSMGNPMPMLQGHSYIQSVMRNPSPSPPGNYGMNTGNYSVQ